MNLDWNSDDLGEKLRFLTQFTKILEDNHRLSDSKFILQQRDYLKSLKNEYFEESKKYILQFINEDELEILSSYKNDKNKKYECEVNIYEHEKTYTVSFVVKTYEWFHKKYISKTISSKLLKNGKKDCNERILKHIIELFDFDKNKKNPNKRQKRQKK